jgi:hypothetical protein
MTTDHKSTKKKVGGARVTTKPLCGNLTRGKGTNKDGSPRLKLPCKRIAGHGTTHLGTGKCKYHGGSNPIKHGLFSKYVPTAKRENYLAVRETADLKSIQDHLALLDGVIIPGALKRGTKLPRRAGDPDPLMVQLAAIETKSRLLKRAYEMDEGAKIKFTEAGLELLVIEIISIIAEFVSTDVLRKITARFGARAVLSEAH